jgi:hypothetical protein
MRRPILLVCLVVGLGSTACSSATHAQQLDLPPITPQRHYNGIVAGEEAYQGNSMRRQAEIGQQLGLNADMYWRGSGISSWYPGVFEAWPIVPGTIFGYPAAVSPPRFTPTSIAPPNIVMAAPARAIGTGRNPAPQEAPRGQPRPGGILPGFAPAPEPADLPSHQSGPRAF